MNIRRIEEGASLTLCLEGRLDTNSAPLLQEAIFSSLEGVTALTLDFAGVDYISSSGLRVLLLAEKEMLKRGGMKLINVGASILDIFEVTGFSEILTLE